MKNKDTRFLPGEAQEDLRRKGVQAVLDGEKQVMVAKRFGVTPRTVNNWMRRYRSGGACALRQGKRGRPKSPSRLTGWQAGVIVRLITDHNPSQLKMPFALWTRQAAADLIAKRFGVKISRWTAGRWLQRWGFTPQKPLRRAYERNPVEVERWLKVRYPQIRCRAKREKARIYWADQTGLRSDHQCGTTYGKKGRTPVVPGTGRRFRCNVVSAVTNRGALAFRVFKGRFSGPVFIDFLRRLIRHARRRVFLIVDQHPVHASKAVERWEKRHADKIAIFFLPGYSPELNPDELVNQDLKRAVGRTRPTNQSELVKKTRSHLYSRQRTPRIVRNFFKEPNVRYAAM
jgi:transposase